MLINNQNKKLGFWDDRVNEETSEGIRFMIALISGGLYLGLWVRTNYNVIWLALFILSISYLIILVVQNRHRPLKNGSEKQ